MGDDVDAPHHHTLEVADNSTVKEIVKTIQYSGYLPDMGKGICWTIVSHKPIAVLNIGIWEEPYLLFPGYCDPASNDLVKLNGNLCFHINYHSSINAEVAKDFLFGSRFSVDSDSFIQKTD